MPCIKAGRYNTILSLVYDPKLGHGVWTAAREETSRTAKECQASCTSTRHQPQRVWVRQKYTYGAQQSVWNTLSGGLCRYLTHLLLRLRRVVVSGLMQSRLESPRRSKLAAHGCAKQQAPSQTPTSAVAHDNEECLPRLFFSQGSQMQVGTTGQMMAQSSISAVHSHGVPHPRVREKAAGLSFFRRFFSHLTSNLRRRRDGEKTDV